MPICLDSRACLLAALLVLTLPLPWIFSAITAAAFHELCHLFALRFLGKNVDGIRIGIRGAEMFVPPLEPKEELLCAAAGPLGSFFLMMWLHCIPRIALCAGIQGFFNLLPLYPMDGGRILRSCAVLLLSRRNASFLIFFTEIMVLGTLCFLAVFFFPRLGWLPVLTVAALVLQRLPRKRPCKQSKLAVQ